MIKDIRRLGNDTVMAKVRIGHMWKPGASVLEID
jgi:pyridoxal biosynthesis lyase PdxS